MITSTMGESEFLLLPLETTMTIMTKLPLSDLANLIRTNSLFVTIWNNDYFWHQKIKEDFPDYFRYPSCISNMPWQFIYREILVKNLRAIPVSCREHRYPEQWFGGGYGIREFIKPPDWLPHSKIWVYRSITSSDLYSVLRSLCRPLGAFSSSQDAPAYAGHVPIIDTEIYREVDIGIRLSVFKRYQSAFVRELSIHSLEENPVMHSLSLKGHVRYHEKDITGIFDQLEEIRFEMVFLLNRCPICAETSCIWKNVNGQPFYHHGFRHNNLETVEE